MITLDQALDRLVYKREYRRAFLEGRLEALELDAGDLQALASMDGQTLTHLAERVAREVLTRKHSGRGSLRELYPRSIEAWHRAHPEDASGLELGFAFLESPAFERYRELPFAGAGASLEESFFHFCELEHLGDPVVREHEFLAAMLMLLVVSPRTAAQLPGCIVRTRHGFVAISVRGTPTLYAAVQGRFVSGQLTPFLVDLLTPGAQPTGVAARYGVSAAVLQQSMLRLSALGLELDSANAAA